MVLPDGTLFAINVGDGFASEYHTHDKSTEDFVIINGTHYKLDITELGYSKDDYMKPKTVKTIKSQPFIPKVFPNRNCEFKFTPTG